jgi:hypothetical protein
VLEQFESIAGERQQPFHTGETTCANPAKGLLTTLFNELVHDTGDTYFTAHGNWLVFGDDTTLLASLKNTHHSLKKYIRESQAAPYCIDNNVFSLFIRPSATDNTELLSYFHPAWQRLLGEALQGDAFKITGVQLRPAGDKLYATFFSVYDNEEPSTENGQRGTVNGQRSTVNGERKTENREQRTANRERRAAKGDEPVARFPVVNHNNKETEYLVQYANHDIALLAQNGTEQWRQKVVGAIVDTVYQLDFYKNGKLQMLFATAGKLYLIDRKGNTVLPFPLSLPATAAKLAVFDYDKNKEYRLFVVQGNKVYAYDKKGRAVDGWKIFAPQAAITRAPEFFRVGGRDYIVVCDEQTTHILDRKGNLRVPLAAEVAIRPGARIIPQQQPPALKAVTAGGKTVLIYLKDGKIN